MKKIIVLLGLSLALAACSKDEFDRTSCGTPFSISLVSPDTRTTNDGLQASWAVDDTMLVMHKEHGEPEQISDFVRETAPFRVKSAGANTTISGEITGVALESGKSYDFLIYYPWKKNLTTLGNAANAKQDIGWISQSQTGVSSKSGLCGSYFPLYGRAEDVVFGTVPTVTMTQQSAVAAICVTNASTDVLDVFNITLSTTSTPLGGRYELVFPEDPSQPLSYKASSFDFNSNFIQLNVTDAQIPVGGTGEFYVAVKPGTLPAGEVLTVGINGENHPIALSKDYTFRPGYIKNVNCTYKGTAGPKYVRVTAAPADWSGEYLFFANNGKKKAQIFKGDIGADLNTKDNSIDAVAEGYASETNLLPESIPYDALTSKSAVIIKSKADGTYSIRVKPGQYFGKLSGSTETFCNKGQNDIYHNKIEFNPTTGNVIITSENGDFFRGRFNTPTGYNNFLFISADKATDIFFYRLEGTTF